MGATALALAGCLLAACSDGGGDAGPERPSASSPASSPSPPPPSTAAPTEPAAPALGAPALDDPARLAQQLELAAATVRAPDAALPDVRRAAELQQLAARELAVAPATLLRGVASRLDDRTARALRGDVRAASLLQAMTEPQPRLPDWRIVAPPPADELLSHYRRAQRLTGVPWTHLAAIHLVETRMGRIRGTSTAGAQGPMQFLPTTWHLYGAGGDIEDPRDAILAAGRLLEANGAAEDLAGALWHYNPSDSYVGAVLEYARTMRRTPSAYVGYWHWRVLYRHVRGTYVLPVGYPERREVLLGAAGR